ncbi:MAG TPA: TIGR04211 family SH3 domain-containing protein [Ectothiorhodospiraceae bacterium]|nr:TIGR04211 family SH3 domain-containing protein [Ectothiorhodospiraceae bacterium]
MVVMRSTFVLAFLLIISFGSHAKSVIYVNDILRVGVRAEPVSGSKTVSVVKTGEALEILDSGDAKYYKVKTPAGRIGWVSRTYVSDNVPAFMRLETVNGELESLKEQFLVVEKQFEQLQETNLSLEGVLSRTKEERSQLQSELDDIKGSALIPEEYQLIAWVTGVLALLLLGFVVGGQRVRQRVRSRLGGLDI